MVCSGICQTLSNYVFGHLVKYTGRIFIYIVAALLNYAMIIFMFLWEPNENQMVYLFVIAGLWGISNAIWQTQVIGIMIHPFFHCVYHLFVLATYTVLYSESDPSALAKYRLWKSVGFVLTYSVSILFFT